MRKISILFIISTILIASCTKEKITKLDLKDGDYFIFGSYAGECYGDCAHFYVLKNNSIYADEIYSFYIDSLKFSSSALPSDKYTISAPLLSNFPTYLTNHKNETFGCPDCTDGGAIYIELKQNGIISHWNIDNFTNNQPTEIPLITS